jgi:hypothetical protein
MTVSQSPFPETGRQSCQGEQALIANHQDSPGAVTVLSLSSSEPFPLQESFRPSPLQPPACAVAVTQTSACPVPRPGPLRVKLCRRLGSND